MILDINELAKMYKCSHNILRAVVCRPEFNKHRVPRPAGVLGKNFFDNSEEFHYKLRSIINLKKTAPERRKIAQLDYLLSYIY